MFDKVSLKKETALECACCSKPSDVQCWGVELCRVCHGAWWTDARFDAGAIDKAIGATPWVQGQEVDRSGELARYEAEAKKRTTAWVAERRVTSRAA